ncbi:isochorismatase family protein [Gudongella sp. SC589]|jgi:nicotinamidase/pyrazinamidase|uniref:isochorismatase family protein n=1 Tax=Gudongella sp. SC589 TaxID=3385990 RepID=UPI003904DA25
MKSLIVVDCQYDFIDGTLACENAENAVNSIIKYINSNDIKVHYSKDWHSIHNGSFKDNGGVWPVHCVQGERGARLHEDFYKHVEKDVKRPKEDNVFYKGIDDEVEEYSAYNAENSQKLSLKDALEDEVIVAGIASEYCVRETVLELLEAGHMVEILKDGLGYVDSEDHLKNLQDLMERGVRII